MNRRATGTRKLGRDRTDIVRRANVDRLHATQRRASQSHELVIHHLLELVAERGDAGLEDHVDALHAHEVVFGVVEHQRVERFAGEEQRLWIRLLAFLLDALRLGLHVF